MAPSCGERRERVTSEANATGERESQGGDFTPLAMEEEEEGCWCSGCCSSPPPHGQG